MLQALHVSQPTLSLQIKQLEDLLQVQLLDRSGRRVRPTDTGEVYLEYARKALRELEAGRRAIHDVQNLSRGSLRIAMTPTFTTYLIGPVMERFSTRYPGVLLNIQEMSQNKMELVLAEDGLDLGIAFSDVGSPEIECQPLFVEKLTVMVGSTHHRANQVGTMTLADLQAESLALLTGDFITRQLINSFFRAQGITPHISVEANSIGAIVEIIRRGNLVTILPHLIAHEHERLCPILLDPPLPYRTAALLRRKGSYETAAAHAFTAIFQSTIFAERRSAERRPILKN
jgi:LysR family transcriptional regulator, cyn operon transcriptional activator